MSTRVRRSGSRAVAHQISSAGGIDLVSMLRALPRDLPVSLEIPMQELAQTMPAVARTRAMLAKARAVLARADAD